MKYALIACLLCLSLQPALAQTTQKGTVTDPYGIPLAFVTILPNDDASKGILTDIEGRFTVKPSANAPVNSLTFRYVGFETLRLSADFWQNSTDPNLKITLQPLEIGIAEVTIRPGENPADVLMRKAIARRKANNPELRDAFSCLTYNKMLFDIVPHRDWDGSCRFISIIWELVDAISSFPFQNTRSPEHKKSIIPSALNCPVARSNSNKLSAP